MTYIITFIISLALVFTPILAQEQKKMTYADRARDAFTRLNINTLTIVDEFYDKDVVFHDPLGSIKGSQKMKSYYKHMYQDLKSIHFTYEDAITENKKVVLVWTMVYATDKLNQGLPIKVSGNSVIVFGGSEDKVIYHRDYFDIGAMVYEHIPVLGGGVKWFREKLGQHER